MLYRGCLGSMDKPDREGTKKYALFLLTQTHFLEQYLSFIFQ